MRLFRSWEAKLRARGQVSGGAGTSYIHPQQFASAINLLVKSRQRRFCQGPGGPGALKEGVVVCLRIDLVKDGMDDLGG